MEGSGSSGTLYCEIGKGEIATRSCDILRFCPEKEDDCNDDDPWRGAEYACCNEGSDGRRKGLRGKEGLRSELVVSGGNVPNGRLAVYDPPSDSPALSSKGGGKSRSLGLPENRLSGR